MTNQKRLLELALTGLKVEQTRIQEEIADINRQLNGTSSPPAAAAAAAPAVKPPAQQRRRRYTDAQKKMLSERMKVYWAQKRKAKR